MNGKRLEGEALAKKTQAIIDALEAKNGNQAGIDKVLKENFEDPKVIYGFQTATKIPFTEIALSGKENVEKILKSCMLSIDQQSTFTDNCPILSNESSSHVNQACDPHKTYNNMRILKVTSMNLLLSHFIV